MAKTFAPAGAGDVAMGVQVGFGVIGVLDGKDALVGVSVGGQVEVPQEWFNNRDK